MERRRGRERESCMLLHGKFAPMHRSVALALSLPFHLAPLKHIKLHYLGPSERKEGRKEGRQGKGSVASWNNPCSPSPIHSTPDKATRKGRTEREKVATFWRRRRRPSDLPVKALARLAALKREQGSSGRRGRRGRRGRGGGREEAARRGREGGREGGGE